ncbi:MAG: hypothetical protein Q9M31_02495 [Mariprofundus sp.]|nr:hypothetical protein [Mariprofundus sp.]
MRVIKCFSKALSPRFFALLLCMGVMLSFGAGYAYSGLKTSDKNMIQVAYINGYKDAFKYLFEADEVEKNKLKNNFEYMKVHIIVASEGYVDLVSSMNRKRSRDSNHPNRR